MISTKEYRKVPSFPRWLTFVSLMEDGGESMAGEGVVKVVELHWLLQMGEGLAALWLYAAAEKLKNVQKTDLKAKHTKKTG
jgi:hypothetical protein